jgi:hypothetical protein
LRERWSVGLRGRGRAVSIGHDDTMLRN